VVVVVGGGEGQQQAQAQAQAQVVVTVRPGVVVIGRLSACHLSTTFTWCHLTYCYYYSPEPSQGVPYYFPLSIFLQLFTTLTIRLKKNHTSTTYFVSYILYYCRYFKHICNNFLNTKNDESCKEKPMTKCIWEHDISSAASHCSPRSPASKAPATNLFHFCHFSLFLPKRKTL
jgi:hypothetical protein